MTTKTTTNTAEKKQKIRLLRPLASGHSACAGCGQMIAAKTVAEALGPNTIIANATGCLEVTTTAYPQTAWGMPWIHSLFENASAVASGISAAVKKRNKNSRSPKIVAQGGDGGTFDIGFGLISGMWERGDDILYICYDTESYSNTGIQASGATPWGASTTTTPSGTGKTIDAIGSHQRKKDMIAIALAHGLNYVAQTSSGFPDDITRKVKKAISTTGPSYIQIMTPCVPGWKISSDKAVSVAKMAMNTGLYPLLEYENGELISSSKTSKPAPPVEKYLKLQGRFDHLFKTKEGKEQIKHVQNLANENIKKYNL